MDIHLTPRFERSFAKLTKPDMRNVRKSLSLLTENLGYPSLQVKKMQGRNVWEARASIRLRMTFDMIGNTIYMRHVGEHDDVLRNP